MPHNPHEALYLRLAEITDRVRMALKDADPDELIFLAEEHRAAMKELLDIGTCNDMKLMEQIRLLHHQVQEVITEMRQRQMDVLAQIRQVSNSKKMVHAYTS